MSKNLPTQTLTKEQAINLQTIEGVSVMSSLRIAEITEKSHRNVTRDIERILNNCKISLLNFEQSYLTNRNRKYKFYALPEREFMIVVGGYDDVYRMSLVDELLAYRNGSIQNQKALPNLTDNTPMLECGTTWNELKPLIEKGDISNATQTPRNKPRRATFVATPDPEKKQARLELRRKIKKLDYQIDKTKDKLHNSSSLFPDTELESLEKLCTEKDLLIDQLKNL